MSSDTWGRSKGCKAHACASDNAAFAINEATGKGDIVFKETADASSGRAVVRSIAWKDLPLGSTPLADWVQSNEKATDSAAPIPASATQQTSFDCSKARSDAERLICNDPELAADDVALASIYAKAKAAVSDQAAFRERTRAEWSYREQTCHDRECLVRWYADQKAALQQTAETGVVAGI